ncbi:myoD family inhibitor domain-containing protein-like [Heterodontus francisci]|uniref:myoD family inhibitor domain-containing protein-like n=1 Tax=Heterodontus francisci TaxID=7792 RepID=UPI00355BFCBA
MSEREIAFVCPPGHESHPESGGEAGRNDKGGDGYSSDSQRPLARDGFCTNESSRLRSSHGGPVSEAQRDTSLPQPANPGPVPGDTTLKRGSSLCANGGPTSSGAQSRPGPPPPPICTSPGVRSEKTRLASTSSIYARGSYKSAASQLPPPAGDDCCVHCILACLFCELLAFCDLVLDCASCGSGGEAGVQAPSCCCGAGEVCGGDEEICPCNVECGVLEDCCGSSDCLEICLECCSICFPA